MSEAAAKAGSARLLLTYMVEGASWSPSYDIRVDTNTAAAKGELQLSYFGLVKNGSGEDWEACKLSLSTAKPSKAGMPPAPPRRMLRWQEAQPLLSSRGMVGARRSSRARGAHRSAEVPMQARAALDPPTPPHPTSPRRPTPHAPRPTAHGPRPTAD